MTFRVLVIFKKFIMPQYNTWEKEYKNSLLVSKHDEPQKDVLNFFRFLKKKEKLVLKNLKVLDLGSGTGRNSNHLAQMGNEVTGLEISDTAINLAKSRAVEAGLKVDYFNHNIGAKYLFEDESFDLILDITSSNSLNAKEREIYLSETNRVLKKNGYIFVRALCKDGDKNAQSLLKKSPGKDYDTYIMKELGLQERVFSKQDFIDMYSKYFQIIKLDKKTSYTRFNNQSYKRNFWLAYMKKA